MLEFVESYLLMLCGDQLGGALSSDCFGPNQLTFEVIMLAKALWEYGFYNLAYLLKLARRLLEILDEQARMDGKPFGCVALFSNVYSRNGEVAKSKLDIKL